MAKWVRMQLAGGVKQFRQRLSSGGGDVVRAGRPALGGQQHRLDAVVPVDELYGRVVPGGCGHDLEVEVARQRLRFLRVEAVAEPQHQHGDARVTACEVAYV